MIKRISIFLIALASFLVISCDTGPTEAEKEAIRRAEIAESQLQSVKDDYSALHTTLIIIGLVAIIIIIVFFLYGISLGSDAKIRAMEDKKDE